MRITGGLLKGRTTETPQGDMAIRPAMDKMRESIFAILGENLRGKSFLDLFIDYNNIENIKAEQLIISTILIIFLIKLIIYKIISKLHLLHFALTFTSFYYYSQSVFFHDHGGFNLIALFIVLFIALVLIFIIKFIFSIFTEKYKYKILSILILKYF